MILKHLAAYCEVLQTEGTLSNLDSLAFPAACEALPNGRTYGECKR